MLAPQIYAVGVLSIPVVALTGMFIGMILAFEGYNQFNAVGLADRMGGIINASVTKQIGPVLAAVSLAGDLFESWLKRKAGVKDSSSLIPGHGGFFDRFDGVIPVAIVVGIVVSVSM